jgi:uncharacterized lipoprotein YddW (UPF0748 family)
MRSGLLRIIAGALVSLVLSTRASTQSTDQAIPKSPKREVRAVWITTVLGLDWPKSFDRLEQERSLRRMVASLRAANFNTIFFQVRSRADAMYHSQYEPWSQQLTGALGEDPGWDPLAMIIQEAHARNIEVHAWFNTFLARSGAVSMTRQRRDWLRQASGGEWWFDPGVPAVRHYILNIAMDLVRHYDVDGIQFDFARYPARSFPDDETYRRYGNRRPKDDWRRDNISAFIEAFHDSVSVVKPRLKIGATPLGIYTDIVGAKGLEGYSDVFQDSRRWLREGWVDYLVPQIYWPLGTSNDNPDFAVLSRDWLRNAEGRHVYVGIGAYKPEVLSQVTALIDTARLLGASGVSFFRYENIMKTLTVENRFRRLALIPPMMWKDPVPPNPPRDVHVSNLADGIFRLQWKAMVRATSTSIVRRAIQLTSRIPEIFLPFSAVRRTISPIPSGIQRYRGTTTQFRRSMRRTTRVSPRSKRLCRLNWRISRNSSRSISSSVRVTQVQRRVLCLFPTN